mmetsp:Transcript_25622/g.43402  ORF Transcript_25622/g.43402 Transcript_25622/m.43402 type:complete len:177 (+) Transcript_25622:1441-1971(+)
MSTLFRSDNGTVLMACLIPKAMAATSLDVRDGIVLRDIVCIKSSFSSLLPDDVGDCCDDTLSTLAAAVVVVAAKDDDPSVIDVSCCRCNRATPCRILNTEATPSCFDPPPLPLASHVMTNKPPSLSFAVLFCINSAASCEEHRIGVESGTAVLSAALKITELESAMICSNSDDVEY